MRWWLFVLCLCATLPAFGGELEDRLRASWQGSWVVLRTEIGSNCDSRYTNVPVKDGRATAAGSQRFGAGELGRVHKLNQQRARIDLLIDVSEPLRTSRQRGPYELFEHVHCKVELEIDVPRDLIKRKAIDEIEATIARAVESYTSRDEAMSSEVHNRRTVEPFPEDYETTLAQYRQWVEQTLAGPLRARLARSAEDSAEVVDDVRRNPAYGDGLARGVADFSRSLAYKDCEDLVSETFYPKKGKAPSDMSGSDKRHWRDGYRDGQVLSFNVELTRAISECLLEISAE